MQVGSEASLPGKRSARLTASGAFSALAGSVLVVFLVVPLAAVVIRIGPSGTFLDQLSDPLVREALRLSLLTTSLTLLITVTLGGPLAYLLARRAFRGRALIDTLVDVPMVLPPAVAGVALLMAFGRRGVLGPFLSDALGVELPFTTTAVVLAQLFVAAPFFVRSARAGFESVDRELEQVATTLGVSKSRVFATVTTPLALPALLGGAVMTWARALGEFGATIMFAGNFRGRTQTMPLAVYTTLESGRLDAALALSVILIFVSFAVLLAFKSLARRTAWGNDPRRA